MSCSVSDDHSADHYFCATASDGSPGGRGIRSLGRQQQGSSRNR